MLLISTKKIMKKGELIKLYMPFGNLLKYLKNELSELLGSRIKWNFTKFLVTNDGIPFRRYGPQTQPKTLEKDIKRLLRRKKKN